MMQEPKPRCDVCEHGRAPYVAHKTSEHAEYLKDPSRFELSLLLSQADREFIKELAFKVVDKHIPPEANMPREALAKDVAEAIEVCVIAKLERPNSIQLLVRARDLWR